MMTTGNTRNYFCIIGVGVEDIDFTNFILLVVWLGVMEIGISVLWFELFDMLVLFVEWIQFLPLESELKILVCRNVLSKLDSFFVICSVGAGFRNVFVCFFVWSETFILGQKRSEGTNFLFCYDDKEGTVQARGLLEGIKTTGNLCYDFCFLTPKVRF